VILPPPPLVFPALNIEMKLIPDLADWLAGRFALAVVNGVTFLLPAGAAVGVGEAAAPVANVIKLFLSVIYGLWC
jgi:hypothetical protein